MNDRLPTAKPVEPLKHEGVTEGLPTKKTPPKVNLADFTILLYGPPGIGKSTWASRAPGALFLATEPGLNSLDVYQKPINNWEEMNTAGKLIKEGNHEYKTIIIDTIDRAYLMCSNYVCAKAGVVDAADLEWGKGFRQINSEFMSVMMRFASLPYGLYFTSHAVERTKKDRTGVEHTKIVPTLPPKAAEALLGFVDIILYCSLDGEKDSTKRIMRCRASEDFEAKDRTSRLPAQIDLDYEKFVAAFNKGGN